VGRNNVKRTIRDLISIIRRVPYKDLISPPSVQQISYGGFSEGLVHGINEAARTFSATACAYEPETHVVIPREVARKLIVTVRKDHCVGDNLRLWDDDAVRAAHDALDKAFSLE
jgi:hypothetical protein